MLLLESQRFGDPADLKRSLEFLNQEREDVENDAILGRAWAWV